VKNVLLITPPMTQLNTPYPATAYLKGFLKKHTPHRVSQRDASLDLVLALFSQNGLQQIYTALEDTYADVDDEELPEPVYHFLYHYADIECRIEPVIRFLQHKDPTLATRIASRSFLPEGPAFAGLHDIETFNPEHLFESFGSLGVQDKAKYLASLFLGDIASAITTGVDPHFALSRYGERLAASNPVFDDLYQQLQAPECVTDYFLKQLVYDYLEQENPDVVGLTLPFPGNVLGALKISRYCKQLNPAIKILWGGGFPNTELRGLKDPRVFEWVDFITLDDGERPLYRLLHYLDGQANEDNLVRTYYLKNNVVVFSPATSEPDFAQHETGTPCYEGLQLKNYLSLCEMLNPMHRIWSDGRWNKLTLAHGCYWKKCSFCDISLNYIQHYETAGIEPIIERIQTLMQQTGESGFHFVDEAAPPKLLFALAEQLISRNIVISWWTNIRFEKTFTAEKCQLLADSGCIAVSGGLEVASDRLLQLMKKGVSVAQVAKVTKAFADAGILVHAYLMYGFPSQTEQETIDSLERVRQLMYWGCIHSAYWHRFAATIHSPVGKHPEHYGITLIPNPQVDFAENDIDFNDPVNTDHDELGIGLNKALYNYMYGLGFDIPLQNWFDRPVKKHRVASDLIEKALSS
jgi:hypothetical protein